MTKKNGWDDLSDAAERGPWPLFVKVLCLLTCAIVLTCAVSWAFGWFSEAASVAKDELGARKVLTRYEWFKDAAAALDARAASIKVYESRFESLKTSYAGKPRHEWTRSDQEQWNVWSLESAGMKASYNNLAAEYNAAMAKVNYRYTNVGDVPAGGQPLPREFRSYEEK